MARNSLPFLLALVAAPSLMFAQDTTRHHRDSSAIDTTRIGIMSPMVVEQRLRTLGYSRVAIVENVRPHVRVNAVKSGRALAVKYDPHSGKTTEVPGRFVPGPRGLRVIRPDGTETVPPK